MLRSRASVRSVGRSSSRRMSSTKSACSACALGVFGRVLRTNRSRPARGRDDHGSRGRKPQVETGRRSHRVSFHWARHRTAFAADPQWGGKRELSPASRSGLPAQAKLRVYQPSNGSRVTPSPLDWTNQPLPR